MRRSRSMAARAVLLVMVLVMAAGALGCPKSSRSDDPRPVAPAPAIPPPSTDASSSSATPADARPPDATLATRPAVTGGASRAAKTTVSGCLAAAEANEAEGSKFGPKKRGSSARSASSSGVRVSRLGTGIIVTHELDHACCLRAHVSTDIGKDRKITIIERLEGTPCRCICSSSIVTTVDLELGEYEVIVVLESGPKETVRRVEVHREAFEIRRIGLGSK